MKECMAHLVRINNGSKNINNTDSYNYLGIHFDMSLNLNDHNVKICKKAASRLGRLRRIRPIRTTYATIEVYKAMVQPVLTYCSIAFISLSETNATRLRKIEKTAQKIIFGSQQQSNYHGWRSVPSMRSIQCALFVFECLNGTGPSVFNNYFRILDHAKATRRNSTDLWLPQVRRESGKRGIYYSGTKIFNALSVHIKTEKYRINIRSALKEHFKD